MEHSRWGNFFGVGTLVMPPLMGFGTDSMDNFAVTQMVMLLLLVLGVAWDQIVRERAGMEDDRER